MRPCVDVILDYKVGRIEVLDDEVPPLLSTDEFAPPRLSDNLRQLPKWELGLSYIITVSVSYFCCEV